MADEEGLPLLDLKDFQSLLVWVGENAQALSLRYGNVAVASVGAIQRRLLVLENQGATQFFGEPALELSDLMRTAPDGRGIVNVLAADKLMHSPRLYATFLLWLLSELFEELPEVGDPAKPKLVFFFDEVHLLFDDAPKALVDKVEQVARLIRSKGVGVYLITQNPADVPENILGQLCNRVQHALRAFTAKDQKALHQAAETYRPNPRFETEAAIREVGVGEAVTSMLEKKGAPGVVERTLIRPPSSWLGPITAQERQDVMARSPVAGKYDRTFDRHSAFEMLKERADRAAEEAARAEEQELRRKEEEERRAEEEKWRKEEEKRMEKERREMEREYARARRYDPIPRRTTTTRRTSKGQPDSLCEALGQAVPKELGGTTGKKIVRGILGSLFKSR